MNKKLEEYEIKMIRAGIDDATIDVLIDIFKDILEEIEKCQK